ncbi:MAG: helix-turn-helix transcriptional regulator [Butyrivibrio sp.]|nr:helix-turn-helix transcriptional regulator [Butyrivibrio sp.]MBP3825220.1 helix-turn-helix transcriptional regulator [Butyrivibrio sp.]
MTIGTRIKNFRTAANMSQTELAQKIKVSKQTLYKYENDIITNIPSDKIELMASALSVTPAQIMGWNESSVDTRKARLDRLYYSLNNEGRDKLIEQAEFFASKECYKVSETSEGIG